ncbi:hypothetical protein JW935_13620 [candidate division KSB1 bacterium]|nr:hypothetical protein [candidate division KSB1 bacterium]
MKTLKICMFLDLFFSMTLLYPQQVDNSDSPAFHIISSSHQDIAWIDTPAACIAFRDTAMLSPALEMLKVDPDYRYTVESTLTLFEFLDRNPERTAELKHFLQNGRLECGAFYNQPYESMYSGEALVRQTYYGRKWLLDRFGYDSRVMWNADVPARAMQIPQIMAKAGIEYVESGRQQEGFYLWKSPDGSSVIAHSAGHYYNASWILLEQDEQGKMVFKPLEQIVKELSQKVGEWRTYHELYHIPQQYGLILSRDWLKPLNMEKFIHNWNRNVAVQKNLPPMRYATSISFFESIQNKNLALKTLVGERPSVWLYIHGPAHHKALSAGRKAWRLLAAAEKFNTIDALLSKNLNNYPEEQFRQNWLDAIYPDHGWGGHNGHITDRVFREKLENACAGAQSLLTGSLESISTKVKFDSLGIPVVVFNPLSWQRTEPAFLTLNPEGLAYPHKKTDLNYRLLDDDGQEKPFQIFPGCSMDNYEHLKILFVAENVPPLGYRTYYLCPQISTSGKLQPLTNSENQFYKITLGNGGIKALYDKKLQKEIFRTEKFLGGELINLHSEGTGAGSFSRIEQPDTAEFEKMSDYTPHWNMIESGPVRSGWSIQQKIRNCLVELRILLYHSVKRIDFECELLGWDGTPFREYRLVFPVNMDRYHLSYDVPMGILQVGKSEMKAAGGHTYADITYTEQAADIHPREVMDWFHVNTGDFGVTVSSSVAVFDWVDMTAKPVAYPLLQPVLLASRRSCNERGNWYLQPGNHSFRFCLTSHKGDATDGFLFGKGAAFPLVAIQAKRGENPRLPEKYSFLSVDGKDIVVSTLKKAEDDDSVILRCYEIGGKGGCFHVDTFFPLSSCFQTNLIETELKPLEAETHALDIDVTPYAIETFKLVPDFNGQNER